MIQTKKPARMKLQQLYDLKTNMKDRRFEFTATLGGYASHSISFRATDGNPTSAWVWLSRQVGNNRPGFGAVRHFTRHTLAAV